MAGSNLQTQGGDSADHERIGTGGGGGGVKPNFKLDLQSLMT